MSKVDGCNTVHHFGSRLVGLCNLNGTLPCKENVIIVLKNGCLSGSLAVVSVFLVILLVVCFVCGYKCWKRKTVSTRSPRSPEEENLLGGQRRPDNMEIGEKIDPSYSSPSNSPNILNQKSLFGERSTDSVKTPHSFRNQGNEQLEIETQCGTSETPSYTNEQKQPVSPSTSAQFFSSPFSTSATASSSGRAFRNEERQKQMNHETSAVEMISKKMFNFKSFVCLPDLGSRLQKYWYKVDTRKRGKEVLATAKGSKQCQLNLENPEVLDCVKMLFQCMKHPCLQEIHDIAYKEGYVGILQEFLPKGSIRDYLFKASPKKDWSDKYQFNGRCRHFSKEKIAICGQQVLKAVEVLYDLGFSHIGQIHSGNVFLCDGNYKLGGFENSLLGYRTSMYQVVNRQDLLDKIDVIMFGHLMYEMCCKQTLTTVLPKDSDYSIIEDSELQELIKFIFDKTSEARSHVDIMKEISLHRLFVTYHGSQKLLDVKPIELPPEVTTLLKQVFPSELNIKVINDSLHRKYTDIEVLPKMGWRFGKIWARAKSSKMRDKFGLLTAVTVPSNCPIFVDVSKSAIETLLLLEHDYIVTPLDIDIVSLQDQRVIVIFQDIIEEGSLRDLIYNMSSPMTAYASKYTRKRTQFTTDQVLSFGAQILQAMYFLSHLEGPDKTLTLGFVHTGNIFVKEKSVEGKNVKEKTCRLGGFENALLGHQTGKSIEFEDCSENIDIFMFGHVIFEMSTGKELMEAVPSEKQYKCVPERFHSTLRNIFDGKYSEIEEVMHDFECAPASPSPSKPLGTDAMYVLEKVRKKKARDQGSYWGRTRHFFQSKFRWLKGHMPKIASP